jgi:hypothetical protein
MAGVGGVVGVDGVGGVLGLHIVMELHIPDGWVIRILADRTIVPKCSHQFREISRGFT